MKSLGSSVCAVLLVAVVFMVAPSVADAYKPLETGVSTPDLVAPTQLGFDRIESAGANYTRIIIFWAATAPANEPNSWDPTDPADPHYDWAQYDEAIKLATDAGLNVLVQIYQAPDWAEGCKVETPGICDPDSSAFADFTEAAAKRYSGTFQDLPRVRYWEPWNEPNLFITFMPQFKNGKKVSPILYRTMLNKFAERVKGVDSTNQVVAGGLAPLQRPGSLGPLDFMRRVLCLEGRKKTVPAKGCSSRARFDIWATNPFTTGGPTHSSAGIDDVSLGDLPDVGQILKAAKRYGKVVTEASSVPFWVTEFSWDSKQPDPGGVPMSILKKWVPEAMYTAWKAGVSKFFWLSLRDWPRPKGVPYSSTFESGLYFRGDTLADDKPKPILKAFRFPFVSYRTNAGLKVWGRTPSSTAGPVIISYRLHGAWNRLGVIQAGHNGVFKGLIRTRHGIGDRGTLKATLGPGARDLGGQSESLPFPLKPIEDFYQPPFG